jgi:hypothetical protein
MQATVRHHSVGSLARVRAPRLRTLSALGAAFLTLIGLHAH